MTAKLFTVLSIVTFSFRFQASWRQTLNSLKSPRIAAKLSLHFLFSQVSLLSNRRNCVSFRKCVLLIFALNSVVHDGCAINQQHVPDIKISVNLQKVQKVINGMIHQHLQHTKNMIKLFLVFENLNIKLIFLDIIM